VLGFRDNLEAACKELPCFHCCRPMISH
jgi:hypothetical protein